MEYLNNSTKIHSSCKMFVFGLVLVYITVVLGIKHPTVKTPLGPVEGRALKSIQGRDYYSFKGIPFAKPPLGSLRFKEPVPPEPWTGTWVANTSYICLQYNHFTAPGRSPVEGNEDCLYLNVYTPTLNPDANLDVIVYIHGGAFMFKWADHGPEIVMDRNVVHVTINYRLGPLGFLSTEDKVLPGNNGLRDQNMALRWVREYIKYFGGNPDSVTISGTSAGGASVHWHYLMPISRGLFHKGISQSGVTLNCWVLMENPLEQTQKLGAIVGCPTENSKELVDCLRMRPGRKITDAVQHFQPWLYNPYSPFGVVVDTWASTPLIPDHPYNLLKNKQVYDVPYMSTYTEAEGLYPAAEFYSKDEYLNDLDTRWNELMPHILHYNFTIPKNQLDKISGKIRKYYLGNEKVSRQSFPKLVELIGDRLFIADIEKAAKLHSAAVKSPVYSYKFSYRGATSCSDLGSQTKENLGAAHADDTNYVFTMQLDTLSTDRDRKMSKILVDIFTTFMKTGVPKIDNVEWEPISKNPSEPFHQLHIVDPEHISMEAVKTVGNSDFWNSLPFRENEKLINTRDEL